MVFQVSVVLIQEFLEELHVDKSEPLLLEALDAAAHQAALHAVSLMVRKVSSVLAMFREVGWPGSCAALCSQSPGTELFERNVPLHGTR